jgi:hypothetical protein
LPSAKSKAGGPLADVCRQIAVSEATFYIWRKKHGHLGVTELRRLRQLEDENNGLKRLVADLKLDKHMLSEALRKSLRPIRRRELTQWFLDTNGVSCKRACDLAQVSRAAWYRPSRARDQSALRLRIKEIAHARPRFGFLRIWIMPRREGRPSIAGACDDSIASMACRCGCACDAASTCRCSAALHRSRRGRPSAGAWILCTKRWRMAASFAC